MLPDSVAVPPAVVRSPAEELATFRLPDGVEARLFACEPMVMDPVVATFDARGALWVAEFTSYMKDVDATDEAEPSGPTISFQPSRRMAPSMPEPEWFIGHGFPCAAAVVRSCISSSSRAMVVWKVSVGLLDTILQATFTAVRHVTVGRGVLPP